MDVVDRYTGDGGRAYHDARAQARSPYDQGVRAAVFTGLTQPGDVALDFGCGTGALLAALPARVRIGVELNELAAAEARTRLDRVVGSLGDVGDGEVDVAVSFHALEHVADPGGVLREVARVLKPGGRLRVVTPYDNVLAGARHRGWRAGDADMHLFSWTPLALGNLIAVNGFAVEECRLAPWTGGGRLGQALEPLGLRPLYSWSKALSAGRLQVIATARRPGGDQAEGTQAG